MVEQVVNRKQVTRQEALAQGLKRYFTGNPCPHGHIAERFVTSFGCVDCAKLHGQSESHKRATQKWELANPESAKQRRKRYHDKNPERARQWFLAWKKRNPDYFNEYLAEWAKRNPERYKRNYQRASENRRARVIGAEGSFTKDDIERIFVEQNGLCTGCGKDIRKTFEIEHIVPLSRGGSNFPANIQLMCRPCNASKATKTMDEWLTSR